MSENKIRKIQTPDGMMYDIATDWDNISDIPASFPPENHTHATLTIGPHQYDGTQNVTIPVYDGD